MLFRVTVMHFKFKAILDKEQWCSPDSHRVVYKTPNIPLQEQPSTLVAICHTEWLITPLNDDSTVFTGTSQLCRICILYIRYSIVHKHPNFMHCVTMYPCHPAYQLLNNPFEIYISCYFLPYFIHMLWVTVTCTCCFKWVTRRLIVMQNDWLPTGWQKKGRQPTVLQQIYADCQLVVAYYCHSIVRKLLQ